MARRATTRSQLSRQFRRRYVFRARHSKILGVRVARNYALDANATRFCRKASSAISKMATRIPSGIHGPSVRIRPKLFRPLEAKRLRDEGGRKYEIEIENDKSNANCIRALRLQPALNRRRKYDDYRLIALRRWEDPIETRSTRRATTNIPAPGGIISGVQDVGVYLPAPHKHVRNFDQSLTGGPFPAAAPPRRLGIPRTNYTFIVEPGERLATPDR